MVTDELCIKTGECGSDTILRADELSLRDQRALVFHVLYAADSFDYNQSLESIVDNMGKGFGFDIPVSSAVFTTASQVVTLRSELDVEIKPLLEHWRFDRLGVSTRLILRLGMWELLYTKIDTTVIINEAVELAKCFAEDDAYKFVNGILDEWVKRQAKKPEVE